MKKKAKRFTGWLLALAMFLTLLPQAVIAEDPGDTGDLTITTLEELEEFRDAVNGGDDFEGKTVVLANDIDMSEKYGADIDGSEVSWTPIGSDSNQFLGTFDGGGYEVRGLYINTDTDNQGLFGYLGEGGIIRNLTVYGMAIGRYQVAGILGYNSSGSVIDCVNNCTITGATTVGGIVGINIGNNATVSTVQGCSNYGMITCTNVSDGGVGGIAGSNSSANAMIEGCTNYGTVQGAADSTYGYIGGITGTNYAVVRNCANEANARISGGAYYSIGGIVGYNYSEITNSYNLGVVESGENAAYRGGIAGLSYQKGYPGDMSNPPRIENCYSNTGSITAGAQEDSVFNSYYLSDTETEEANGMTGKTTAQFASGEVAWLLQNGQTTDSDGVKPQVWGQTLSGETPDAYPVFTSDSARSLVKVSFMTGDTEYAAAYANPGGTVTLPQAPTMMNNEFAYWTTSQTPSQTEKTDEFTASTTVSQDTTVYAVFARQFTGTDAKTTVYAGVGGSVEIDLYDYIEFADTSLSEEGQFTFTADAALPNGVTMDGSKVTWAPADEAEPVDVTFTVTDNTPYISLAGLDNDPASVTAKLTITFAVAPDMSSEFTPDESDASKTTYLISSKEDMEALAAYINGGNTAEGMTFKMTKDIDLEGSEDDQWMPIGGQSIHFNGTFDGGGYEVSGLYINSTSNFQGLFGYTGEQSVIRGVSVSGTVKGTYSVGGVVGRNDGIVENCRNSCVISNTANYVGGVVGFNGGTVRSSYNDGAVSGGAHVGGVTGYNYGSNSRVENCYNKGTVNGAVDVGGIAGANEGAIVNSYSVGTVSGSVYVGGISGYGSGEVMGSYYLEGTAEYDAVGGEMKTAEQFAQQSTFTDAGWDLTETWVMDEWFGRPVLQDPRELSGSGTESDPYVIPDLPTLERFRKTVEDGSTYAGQYVELTNDIDMSRFYGADIGGTEVSWTPIGSSSHPFNGTFNGGGYEISGLYINSSDNYQGLFGYLGTGGTICGLTVSGSVTGGNFVGGIAGGSVGSIFDCENKCDVSGSNIVGGVVGIVNGASTANAAVSGCVNSGSVESTAAYSSSIAGGIVGSADNEYVNIEECANYGRVGSTSSMPVSNVGGIVGTNYGTVAMSVNGQGAEIYGSVCAFGGIAGYNFHNILNCYNLGTLTATGIPGDATIGGIAGASYQAGYPGDTSNPPRIENCYSNTGSITAGAQEDSVFNSYYLSDTETEEANGMTGKTIAQFASGEVARLLQDGQTADDDGVKPQVWGQTLSGDTPDTYPVLTSDSARTLVKVSFMADDTEYAAAYTNPGGTVTLPQDPTSDEYEFVRWSQTQSTDGTAFTAQTAVNGDMTVYAVGEEMYGETGAEKKIETTYGTAATKDLSDYMTYAAGTDASEKFTYEITGGNNKTATANGNTVNASISGDTLSIPAGTNADTYTLTIRATAKKPVISMFAVDYDTEPVTFDVTVVVAKVSAGITMAPTANTLTYNGTAQALVKAGTAVGGTLIYSLAEDGEYSANIPTGTEADTYTVWYKVSADSNHNDTEPQSITVTISKAGSDSEVSGSETVVYGETLTLTAKVSRAQLTNGVLLYESQDEVEFFVGNTSLGTAKVEYDTMFDDEGTATLYVNTSEKQLAIGDNTIKAVYGGSVNLNGSESDTITVEMQQKPIEYTVMAEDKVYDGDTEVTVTLTPTNVIGDDDVSLTATGNTASSDAAVYERVDLTTITLSGDDMGYYSVSASANGVQLSEPVEISKAGSDSEVSGSETVVYGETLTLTAEVSRAQAGEVSLMAAQDEVEFFAGETSLGTADVVYDTMLSDEGTATLNVNTSEKQLAIGDNTIKAVYGGSVNLNGSESDTITVNMQPKPIEYTVTAEDKIYDGTNTVNVTLTPTNAIQGDDVTLTAEGTVETASTGEYTAIDLSNIAIGGEDSGYYSVSETAGDVTLAAPVSIKEAAETISIAIDYANETLTGFEAGRTYIINGEEATPEETTVGIDDQWFGTDVTIVKKAADEDHVDSETQTVSIPERPDAPDGISGSSSGRISGVDETMEYREDGDESWTAIDGSTVTGLSYGTYEVRIKATDSSFASEAETVTIRRRSGSSGGSSSTPATTTPTVSPTEAPTEEPTATEEPHETERPSENPSDGGYSDVSEDMWYSDTVDYVTENGLMNGTSETEFSPNADITRGMFVTVLYRMENSPETELDYSFTDVAADAYYAEAVAWADDNGIVTGYSDTEFAPEQTINREQMAAIIYRYADYKGEDTAVSGSVSYADAADISEYALTSVIWVSENRIMQGRTDNTFAPAEFTTRAEAAAVFERTHKRIVNEG